LYKNPNQTKFSLEEKIMSRKSILLALSFLALVALALAACTPTEVVKTVVVTQEVMVEGTPVVQEVVVTATPAPEVPTQAAPRTLVICLGQEPDTLYIYGGSMLAASQVQEAIYDGPIDNRTFDYQPIILEKLPSLADGDAVINPVAVAEGDTVADNDGNPATLTATTADTPGTLVRPAGCRSADCAVEYDGTNVAEMDQMVVTTKLLPGLMWSDGTPLTAADSVYSFGLYMDPDTPNPSRYTGERTASYTAPDDVTNVWTGIPGYIDSTYFINTLGTFPPMPQHVMGQYAPADLVTAFDADKLWVGWGAYVIDDWVKGEQITLHKNPNYFRASEGLPKFDNLVYRLTAGDANAAIAAVLAGECDIVDQTTSLDAQSQLLLQLQAKGQVNATFVTGTTWEHADFLIRPAEGYLNTGDFSGFDTDGDGVGPFGDARLRQAVTMCMDRQSVVDTVLYGQSIVIDTYLPPNHPLYNADSKHYDYDPAAAQALLDEVGWVDSDGDPSTPRVASGVTGVPDGTPLAFKFETTNAAMRQQYTQILAQSMNGCGIGITLNYWNSTQWFADGPEGPLFGLHYDLGAFAWLTGVQPPCDLYLTNQIPNADNGWAGQNDPGYSNPAFDTACNMQLQSLPGEDNYVKGAKDAQFIFSEDVPVAPLFLRLKLAVTRPDMCNFVMDPTANSEMWNIEEFDYGAGCGG
jgi:peptide/nickel transport system substrate-binding protein